MERDPLVYAVIGHMQRVHREIGPGIDERFYHELLVRHLTGDGIEHIFKPRRALYHRGVLADIFEPDLVVGGRLIPELKVLPGRIEPVNFLQIQAYLKQWKIRQGLLVDFGKEKLSVRSYLYDEVEPDGFESDRILTGAASGWDGGLLQALAECFSRIGALHGLGYRDKTYRGLLLADLDAEHIGYEASPTAVVRVEKQLLGYATLKRFIAIEDRVAVLILSQRQEIRPVDRAVVQTALRLLELPCGMIAHFGRHRFETQWVLPASRRNRAT
jgi:GxxExxY protein